ncbi:MAG: copper amine oxidase N-terminal domain-containing protein, partial [Desulfocucumaceae bacterium]
MKKAIVCILFLISLLGFTSQAEAQPNVLLNGQALNFDVAPEVENGRILVPVRAIFEAMGANLVWDGVYQAVIATRGDIEVVLQIGNDKAFKNGNEIKLDVPAKIMNGRTMVPLRFVSESFGAEVSWDADTSTVNVTYNTAAAVKKKYTVTNEKAMEMLRDPKSFTGYPVNLKFAVISEPVYTENYTIFEAWLDPAQEKGTTVFVLNGALDIEEGDFNQLTGVIGGELLLSEIMIGEVVYDRLIGILLDVNEIKPVTPIEVLAPVIKTVKPNKTASQNRLGITVEKVEFARQETRVFVNIKNGSRSRVIFADAKALQGSRQYDLQEGAAVDYEDYPEVQGDLLPGVETSGVIVFGPAEIGKGKMTLYFDVIFDDSNLESDPMMIELI